MSELTSTITDSDETTLSGFGARASVNSDALRALSHEHRLMILCLLTGRERSVGELEQILKLPQPAVSQQLARLRLDSLVTSRRNGRTIFYTAETVKLEVIYRDLGVILGFADDSVEMAARIDAEIAASMPAPVVVAEQPEATADGEIADGAIAADGAALAEGALSSPEAMEPAFQLSA